MADLAAIILKADSKELKKATADLKRLGITATVSATKVDKFNKRTEKSAAAAASLKGKIVALAGAYIGLRAVVSAGKIISQFSDRMLELQAVTGATAQQFADMEQIILRLGASTRFTASEAAAGMTFLARAGFTANEAIAALPATLDLAAAGILGLGEAADIASNVLRQFNLEAEQTVRIGDVLVTTANSANTNVSQLAQAMKFAGPVASAMGVSLEETAAAMGAMGDGGIQAHRAGTQLRGILLALTAPTNSARKALQEMGLTAADVSVESAGLTGALAALAASSISASQAEAIFGRRNVAGALILSKSIKRVRELTVANKNSEGAAKRAADTMNSGLGGALKRVTSAWEGLILTARSGEGAFTDTANFVATLIGVIAGSDEAIARADASMLAIAATIKSTLVVAVLLLSKAVIGFGAALASTPMGAFSLALVVMAANAQKVITVLEKMRVLQKITPTGIGGAASFDAVLKGEATEAREDTSSAIRAFNSARTRGIADEAVAIRGLISVLEKEKEARRGAALDQTQVNQRIASAKLREEFLTREVARQKELNNARKEAADIGARASAIRGQGLDMESAIRRASLSKDQLRIEDAILAARIKAEELFSGDIGVRSAFEMQAEAGTKALIVEEKRVKVAKEHAELLKKAASATSRGFFMDTLDKINMEANKIRESDTAPARGGTFGVQEGNVSFAALAGGFDTNKKQLDEQKLGNDLLKKANSALLKIEKKIDPVARYA